MAAGWQPVNSTDLLALEATNAALYAALETGDYDAMSQLWVDGEWADSARCVHPGWMSVVGRGPVLRSWALIIANTTYIQFFLTDLTATVVGDVGVVTCAENVLIGLGRDASGAAALGGSRVETTNLFRRAADGWRVWQHHASPVLAPDDLDADELDADERGEPTEEEPG